MTQGIFVRECPSCKRLKHTHDQTGKSKCAKCEAKSPTPPALHVVDMLPPEEDDEVGLAVSVPPPAATAPMAETDIVESFDMPGFTVSSGPTVDAPVTEDEGRGRSKKKH